MSLQDDSWSIGERKKLARLLYVYPLDAYENIAANMKRKSADQVEYFLKKMILATKSQMNKHKTPDQPEPSKAPLETWLDVVGSLVNNEQYDYSRCLSKVMAFISHFEEFPRGDIEGHPQPDYKAIYKYLSQILEDNKSEDIEELGPLECCVVVDLLHSLMEVFSECDLSVQFNVLRWKYFLLNERDHLGHPIPELLRQASENDFGEFLKGVESSSSKEKESISSTKEGQSESKGQNDSKGQSDTEGQGDSKGQNESRGQSDSKGQADSKGQSDSREQGTSTDKAQEKSGQSESKAAEKVKNAPQKVVAHYTYEASYSASNERKKSDPRNHLNDLVYRNKPGRKTQARNTTVVTEIVHVIPPKNAKIVQIHPRAKKPTIRDDGKYFGINCEHNVKKVIDNNRQMFPDVSEPVIVTDDNQECIEASQARKRKYKTLIKKKDAKKEVKKPKLYSLNPFCLPISLLDIDS